LARKPYELIIRYCTEFAQRLQSMRGTSFGACDLLIDAPPVHRELKLNIPIYYPRQKVYRRLDEVSPVVGALARTQFDDFVKRVRIYAHPRVAQELRGVTNLQQILIVAINGVDRDQQV